MFSSSFFKNELIQGEQAIQGHYNIYIIKDVRGRAQHPGQQNLKKNNRRTFCLYIYVTP